MRVVTAADHRMKDWGERCKASAKALGYAVTVYELDQWEGDLGLEWDLDGFRPCYFKIEMLRAALSRYSPILYLDADCILQRRVDEIWDQKFDVALTLRREPEVHPKAGTINSGVMAFRRSKPTTELLDTWENLSKVCVSEQQAMNALKWGREWTVALLPGEIYNNYYFDGTEKDAAIIHYKTDKRYLWGNYETNKQK